MRNEKVDKGCAGYNLVFGLYWHLGDTLPPLNVTYSLWATNPTDTTTLLTDISSFEVSALAFPIPPPPPPTQQPTPFPINVTVFIEVGFTAQGDTHIHIVLDTYPPRMDYVGFIQDLTCDEETVLSQYQPSQFEHTFDIIDGVMYSRYNLSWMIGSEVCGVVGYGVVMMSGDGGYGESLSRKIVPQTIEMVSL
jgi:hypothetical protein